MKCTRELQNLYENPNSIPALLDIYSKNESVFLKKCSSIGIKRCISICSDKIKHEDLLFILLQVLNLIFNEGNSDITITLLLPLEKIYEVCGGKYEFIDNFVSSLVADNQFDKCLTVLLSLAPLTKDVVSSVPKFLSVICACLESLCRVQFSHKLFKLFSSSLAYIRASQAPADEQFIFDTLSAFSHLFIETLDRGTTEDIQNMCNVVVRSYELGIEPISVRIIIEPLILFLNSQLHCVQSKISVLEVIGFSISRDETEIDTGTIVSFLDMCLNLTILSFQDISCFIDDRHQAPTKLPILSFLSKLPDSLFHDIVQERITKLNEISESSHIFTSILLIQCSLRTKSEFLKDLKDKFLYYCLSGFYDSSPSVQSISCRTLKTCYFSISEQINSNLTHIINKVISMIYDEHFFEGIILIPNILYDVIEVESFFELLFSVCCFTLNCKDIKIVSYSWLILSIISLRSEDKVREYFARIYSLSYEFLQKDIQIHSSNALQCICSLSRSCCDLFSTKLEEINRILIKWYFSDDTSVQQDSISGFTTFIKTHPQQMERFVPIIFPRIIENCTCDYPEELLKEIHQNESNSVFNFVTRVVDGDLRLLSSIVRHYPQHFRSNDIVLTLFSCLFKGYQCILNTILISSNILFRSLLHLNINNATRIFCDILLTNLRFLENSRDPSLVTSCIKTFNASFKFFGTNIFNGKEDAFFDLCLALLDQRRGPPSNPITSSGDGDTAQLEDFHHRVCSLMRRLAQSPGFAPELVHRFIPDLIKLLNSRHESERVICIEVLSCVAGRLPDSVNRRLFQISLEHLSKDEDKYSSSYSFFLFQLIQISPQFFTECGQYLINFIVSRVCATQAPRTCSIAVREHLLGLFASLDALEPFAGPDAAAWLSGFLPPAAAPEVAPCVYGFVARHFPRFRAQLSRAVIEPFSTRNVPILNSILSSPPLMADLHKCARALAAEMYSNGDLSLFGLDSSSVLVFQRTLDEVNDILSKGTSQNFVCIINK